MRGKAAAAATTKNERNIWSDKRGPIGLFEQILVWRRRNKKTIFIDVSVLPTLFANDLA